MWVVSQSSALETWQEVHSAQTVAVWIGRVPASELDVGSFRAREICLVQGTVEFS